LSNGLGSPGFLPPTEAAELLKKADYLELPSATLIERKK
jgi:hypothetical protein